MGVYYNSLAIVLGCGISDSGKAINEAKMLQLIHSRSNRLEDGQDVLDLGCGWGSFGLYIAERYPNSSVTCLSNSKSQAEYIMSQCAAKGITNLKVKKRVLTHYPCLECLQCFTSLAELPFLFLFSSSSFHRQSR